MSSSTPSAKDIIKRIFCYGDSLTAGTAPPSDQLFPYGPHLEKELNYNLLEGDQAVMVRWRGLPGWTADAMVDYISDGSVGLQSAVLGIRDPSLSLVIILAGTNDVGVLTSSMGGSNNIDANEAIEPILSLHKTCLECEGDGGKKDVHTLAVGIPGSGWQEMNADAARLCREMNEALQKFASDNNDRVAYCEFPFSYARGDSKWSGDGLHLSPEGYETLGKSLAPCVKQILDKIGWQ